MLMIFLVETSSEQKDSLARYHIENLAPEKDGIGTHYRIDMCSVFSFQPDVDPKRTLSYLLAVLRWLSGVLACCLEMVVMTATGIKSVQSPDDDL